MADTPQKPDQAQTPPAAKRAAAEGETIDINKITSGKTLTPEEAEKVAARLARELGEDEDPPAKPATPATAKTTPGENGNGKTPPPAYSIPGVDDSSLDNILGELPTENSDASPEEVAAAIAAEMDENPPPAATATPNQPAVHTGSKTVTGRVSDGFGDGDPNTPAPAATSPQPNSPPVTGNDPDDDFEAQEREINAREAALASKEKAREDALVSEKVIPRVKTLFARLAKNTADCQYDHDAQMHTITLSAELMKLILQKDEKESYVLPQGAWKDLLPVTRWKVPKEAMDTLLEKDETPESLIARLKEKPEFEDARITAAGNKYQFEDVPVATEAAALFSEPALQAKVQKSSHCTLRITKEEMDEILNIAYSAKPATTATAKAEIPRLPPVKPASAFDERKLLEFLSTCYPEGCRVTYDAERKEFTVEASAKTLLIAPLRDSGMTESETNENTRFEGGDTLKLHIAAAAVQRMHERAKTQPMRGIKPVNLPLKKAAIAPAVVDRRYEAKQKLKKALGPGTRIADDGTGEGKGWEIAAAAPDPEDIRKILAALGIKEDVAIIPTGTTQWYAPKEFMDKFAPQTANLKPDYESWAHRSSQGAIQNKFDTELKSKDTEIIKNPTPGAHAYIIDNVTASTNVPLTKPPIKIVPKFTFRLPEPMVKALIGQQPTAAAAR